MEPNLIIGMVGQPGRGKESIATRLSHYLKWLNMPVKLFVDKEAIQSLRKLYEELIELAKADSKAKGPSHHKLVNICLDTSGERLSKITGDVQDWLKGKQGAVAIVDAPNATPASRSALTHIGAATNSHIMFIESYMDADYKREMESGLNSMTNLLSVEASIHANVIQLFDGHVMNLVRSENLPSVKIEYTSNGYHYSSYKLPTTEGARLVIDFIQSVKPWPPVLYMTTISDIKPPKEHIKAISKVIGGKELFVYMGTSDQSWETYELLQDLIKHPVSNDIRNEGVYILKALDGIVTTASFEGMTYSDIYNTFINNEDVNKNARDLELNTDTMEHHVAERTIILAHKGVNKKAGLWATEVNESETVMRQRIGSIILALEFGNPGLVIVEKDTYTQLSQYYSMSELVSTEYGTLSSANYPEQSVHNKEGR